MEVIEHTVTDLNYTLGEKIATRAAFGKILHKVARKDPRVIGVDMDVKNSTMLQELYDNIPDQFCNCFVAEQNGVGVSLGLSWRQRIPFVGTFATFFTRGFDHIRMAAVSQGNVKYIGSHCGVTVGVDGPSQMGLEDIAMFRTIPGIKIYYPSDAVSLEWAVAYALNYNGAVFIRTNRPVTPVLYANDTQFEDGKSRILKQSDDDKVTIIGAGITLAEALEANTILEAEGIKTTVIDLFSVKPVDRDTIVEAARKTDNKVLVVEDHYPEGGCAEAVMAATARDGLQIHHLAVFELPHSGQPQ